MSCDARDAELPRLIRSVDPAGRAQIVDRQTGPHYDECDAALAPDADGKALTTALDSLPTKARVSLSLLASRTRRGSTSRLLETSSRSGMTWDSH